MNIELPSGYLVRPAIMDDVDGTVAMLNQWAIRTLGVEKFNSSETGSEWGTPGFNLETDTRLVLAPDGSIVAYYEVWDIHDPHVRIHCWGRVHPDHTGRGIGSYLLSWAQERAGQAVLKAPPEARIVLLAHALSKDTSAKELFRQTGFKFVRHSLRMVLQMNGKPPEPSLPDGIQIRKIAVGREERAVILAMREAFKDHWGHVDAPFDEEYARWEHFMQTSEIFDPTLWYLAMDGADIAGVSLCYPKSDDDPDMGWVGVLGVRRSWRRRGIALALLHHSFREIYKRDKRMVGLGVDAESLTGATRLYQKAGMHSDPNWQFSLYEKELRSGQDLTTQSV